MMFNLLNTKGNDKLGPVDFISIIPSCYFIINRSILQLVIKVGILFCDHLYFVYVYKTLLKK